MFVIAHVLNYAKTSLVCTFLSVFSSYIRPQETQMLYSCSNTSIHIGRKGFSSSLKLTLYFSFNSHCSPSLSFSPSLSLPLSLALSLSRGLLSWSVAIFLLLSFLTSCICQSTIQGLVYHVPLHNVLAAIIDY